MSAFLPHRFSRHRGLLPVALWLLIFLAYFPSAEAGRVADFPGLYGDWQHNTFPDYLNRRWSYLPGMYQLTQLVTWCMFSLFDIAPWPWHLLQITLHAANAWLLFRLVRALVGDTGRQDIATACGVGAAVLFAVQPAGAEAVIWEPAYHYPQALLLQLGILLLARKYMLSGSIRYAILAAALFFASTFTLELFYLTVPYTVLLFLLYRLMPGRAVPGLAGRFLRIILPQLILLGLYFVLMSAIYDRALPRGGATHFLQDPQAWLRNPAKNTFNLFLFGRFWPRDLRMDIYHFLDGGAGQIISWIFFAVAVGVPVLFWRKLRAVGLLVSMLLLYCLLCMLSTGPLQFDEAFSATGERYLYCALAPFSALLALLICRIKRPVVRTSVTAAIMVLLLVLLLQRVRMWQDSARIADSLCREIPHAPGKTILLLNVPQVYDGIPMFGAGRESVFAGMREALYLPPGSAHDSIIEVTGYNMMMAGEDGVGAEFLDDSTVRVALHQWGRWWIRGALGESAYATPVLSLTEMDGHQYVLHLHRPASEFVLYRQQGEHWYRVDPKK